MLTNTDTDISVPSIGIGIGMNTRYRSNPNPVIIVSLPRLEFLTKFDHTNNSADIPFGLPQSTSIGNVFGVKVPSK